MPAPCSAPSASSSSSSSPGVQRAQTPPPNPLPGQSPPRHPTHPAHRPPQGHPTLSPVDLGTPDLSSGATQSPRHAMMAPATLPNWWDRALLGDGSPQKGRHGLRPIAGSPGADPPTLGQGPPDGGQARSQPAPGYRGTKPPPSRFQPPDTGSSSSGLAGRPGTQRGRGGKREEAAAGGVGRCCLPAGGHGHSAAAAGPGPGGPGSGRRCLAVNGDTPGRFAMRRRI